MSDRRVQPTAGGGYKIRAYYDVLTHSMTVGLHRYDLDRDRSMAEQAVECRAGATLLLAADATMPAKLEADRLYAIANLLDDLSGGYDKQEELF